MSESPEHLDVSHPNWLYVQVYRATIVRFRADYAAEQAENAVKFMQAQHKSTAMDRVALLRGRKG